MKLALVALLFVIAVLSASGTSPPDCSSFTCTEGACTVRACECGAYKDDCNCCDICYKCPEQECNSWYQHLCSSGYTCVLDNHEEPFEFGGTGHCKPENSTSA